MPGARRFAASQPCADCGIAGTLLGTLPLTRAGAPVQPFGVKFGGRGLDARLITDLSLLEPGRLITPNPLAYIRTECPPDVAADRRPWTITTSGLVERSDVLTLDALAREARPMGAHLFECAGNNNPANFGLMSVAEWDGVPLTTIVSRLKPTPNATGVLVIGRDYTQRSAAESIPGASWVFPLASLERLGAFLAVRMNGEALPLDHGKPVRLVVPGWYGCAWIKWVRELRLVGNREPATSQMREFAGRTHQSARHALAADYAPPDIQAAATPVRVEKRRVSNGLEYRIVGIVWGEPSPWIAWPSVSARTIPGNRSRFARFPLRMPSGRCGNTAGGLLHQGYTASACKCPIRRFRSVASRPDTTCARSKLMKCRAPKSRSLSGQIRQRFQYLAGI